MRFLIYHGKHGDEYWLVDTPERLEADGSLNVAATMNMKVGIWKKRLTHAPSD